MTEKQERLVELLREMFQLEHSELDFGIYRIMNAKSEEIDTFLEKELIASIREEFASEDNQALQEELKKLVKTLEDAGVNPDESPKVQELRQKLEDLGDINALED